MVDFMQAENLSRDLLLDERRDKNASRILNELSSISFNSLKGQLKDDDIKKTFWINLYNAFNVIQLKQNPGILNTQGGRLAHFSKIVFNLGGKNISLNLIEHGLLRISKIWWAKGYVTNPFVSTFEKTFRLQHFDPRIHFALNCGATSCPPIRIYESSKIDHQLELATISFLDSKTYFYPEENLVKISQLFNWYSGDFGGEKGILTLLKKYQKIPENSNPLIIYNTYNWAPAVGIFLAV